MTCGGSLIAQAVVSAGAFGISSMEGNAVGQGISQGFDNIDVGEVTTSGVIGAVMGGASKAISGSYAKPQVTPNEYAGSSSTPKQAAKSTSNSSGGGGSSTQSPETLYHYTNEDGLNGILNSNKLKPSLKGINPNDVRYGNGQYMSDVVPGIKSTEQLSKQFINNPFQGARYSHYVGIDVTGLNVVQGRPGVFVIPNEGALDLANRIVSAGMVP